MTTLSIKTFRDNLDTLTRNGNIYVLSPVSRTETLRIKVSKEDFLSSLKDKDPEMSITFHYYHNNDITVGFHANAFARIQTQYLKDKWERRNKLSNCDSTLLVTVN